MAENRGRPRKDNSKFTISLNNRLKELLTIQAITEGKTRSEYIEKLLLKQLNINEIGENKHGTI